MVDENRIVYALVPLKDIELLEKIRLRLIDPFSNKHFKEKISIDFLTMSNYSDGLWSIGARNYYVVNVEETEQLVKRNNLKNPMRIDIDE